MQAITRACLRSRPYYARSRADEDGQKRYPAGTSTWTNVRLNEAEIHRVTGASRIKFFAWGQGPDRQRTSTKTWSQLRLPKIGPETGAD